MNDLKESVKSRVAVGLGLAILLTALGFWPGPVWGEQRRDEDSYAREIKSTPPLSETERRPGWSYNTEYIYAISRSLGESDLPVAGKVPLFLPSLVVDTVLLPVALIAGLFGE